MILRDKYKYGKTSEDRMSEVSPYLVLTARYMLRHSPIDAGIPWRGGKREDFEQHEIYVNGHSRCDGFNIISYHQKTDENGKGLALDIVPYIHGEGFVYTAYARFGMLGTLMLEAWEELQDQDIIPKDLYLHWGGFWENKEPKDLGWDMAHYEIRDYPQITRI